MTVNPAQRYRPVLHAGQGDSSIALRPDIAHITVNNLVFVAREGLHDAVTPHRVIPWIVAQGGDPMAAGSGGSGG